MKGTVFPDQIHIEKIRNNLWCGRELSHASVMVGAGFSRNADVAKPSARPFPLWSDLSSAMLSEMNPMGVSAFSNTPVRLASEYEATFGRAALDNLILKNICDEDYRAGRLHELLLKLPWSDVFTTNYDTLLERARESVYERYYELIQTVSDIPHHMRPRIVKLHGSFPSYRPFIVTEDDYRTYPVRFAPFVNMVQQSIMENSLCLLGFSGDDPNFLYWSGWVRDNLGESAPPIYLCGLLDLTESQRRLLENRKVIPIDLSPLFPVVEWPISSVRHSKAIEWFLLTLLNGAPLDKEKWPSAGEQHLETPSDGLPVLLSGPKFLPDQGSFAPEPRPATKEQLLSQRRLWTDIRLAYPGWVILPEENRKTLWLYTQYWIDEILAQIDKIEPPEDLFLLFELNWRLEKTLCPLFINQVQKISAVVLKYNPFPTAVCIESAEFTPAHTSKVKLDWDAVAKAWIELAFALLREARDDQDAPRVEEWIDRLSEPAAKNPEWQARLLYEKCLFHLYRLNENEVRTVLSSWPDTPNAPFWSVRRSAILAELGDMQDAIAMTEKALSEIRSRNSPHTPDYALLSQEGWAMSLLRAIRMQNDPHLAAYQSRWSKLEKYHCNPWHELGFMKLKLLGPSPNSMPEKQMVTEFDPGRITVNNHFGGDTVSKLLPAFAFLRLFEEAGVPMRCANVDMFSEEGAVAARWIEPFAPYWSLLSVIRSDNEEPLKARLTRTAIVRMTPQMTDLLYDIAMESLKQAVEKVASSTINYQDNPFCCRVVKSLTELLSRIAFRLDDSRLSAVFEFAIALYQLPSIRSNFALFSCLDALFKRILLSVSESELIRRMPELLALPIPGVAGFMITVPFQERWPEPFGYINGNLPFQRPTDVELASWQGAIASLLSIVRTGAVEARKRASMRLITLCEMNILTENQKKELGEALWCRICCNTGLPEHTNFHGFAFMQFPEPREGMAKHILHDLLLSRDFPRTVKVKEDENGREQKTASIQGGANRYISDLLGASVRPLTLYEKQEYYIDWSYDETRAILDKVVAWWDEEKRHLRDSQENSLFGWGDELRCQLGRITDVMAEVILPRLEDVDNDVQQLAWRVITEMEENGISIARALPMCMFLFKSSAEQDSLIGKIRASLMSTESDEIRGATSGIFMWAVLAKSKRLPALTSDLFDELVSKVLFRRQPGLDASIDYVRVFAKRLPNMITEKHLHDLAVGLEYLARETNLSEQQENGLNHHAVISVDQRPWYRKIAASLAFTLYMLVKSRGEEPLRQLVQWKSICMSDSLPEVRKAWPEHEENV